MQIVKSGKVKVQKEILWKYHEQLQREFKPLNEWYKLNSDAIQDLDEERQKIIRKYFRFQAGELMKDKKGAYILLHGVKMKDYEKEMEELMIGEVELEDNGAVKWPTSIPLTEEIAKALNPTS